jgi:hypothetical protein
MQNLQRECARLYAIQLAASLAESAWSPAQRAVAAQMGIVPAVCHGCW